MTRSTADEDDDEVHAASMLTASAAAQAAASMGQDALRVACNDCIRGL